MTFDDILQKKKQGAALSREEIRFFVRRLVEEQIPDYKTAAFLMAVCFVGMTAEETFYLTDEMAKSGDALDLSAFGDLSADKHSTGGVGDKTTLIVAPIAAAAGCKIAKMSGRGLGDTGGTIDKLESIPSFRVILPEDQFFAQVQKIGIAVVGQSGELAPADKKLYALRDVTCTVDSLPLIASSIMSKKLAAGAHNIVLDVKYGSGAFMKTPADAAALAEAMLDIGRRKGRRMAAVISDMNTPLGRCVGNALEVREAMQVLEGETDGGALREVSLTLAGAMIALTFQLPFAKGFDRAQQLLENGKALQKFTEWIGAQGGDAAVADHPDRLPLSPCALTLTAPQDGYLSAIDAGCAGRIAKLLGAGRQNKGDAIDYGAGLEFLHTVGDFVKQGEPVVRLYTKCEDPQSQLGDLTANLLWFSDKKPQAQKPIVQILGV